MRKQVGQFPLTSKALKFKKTKKSKNRTRETEKQVGQFPRTIKHKKQEITNRTRETRKQVGQFPLTIKQCGTRET